MLFKRLLNATTILLCLWLSGCMKNGPVKSISNDSVELIVALKDIKPRDDYFVLYGNARFKSKQAVGSVDLTCLSLKVGEQKSNGIYVDSVASFLATHYKTGNTKEFDVDVYWVFRSEIDAQLLDNFQLVLVGSSGSEIKDLAQCMTFSE